MPLSLQPVPSPGPQPSSAQRRAPSRWPRGLLLALLPACVVAQVPDAGSLLRQQEQARPAGMQRLPQTTAAEPARMAPADAGGVKVIVRQVTVEGAADLGVDADLQAITAAAIGRELGFSELEALAEQVSRALKARGWVLTRAFLPQQDISQGSLRIQVERGRLEGAADGSGIDVRRDRSARLDPTRVARTVGVAVFSRRTDTVNETALERGVLLLNDLPGVNARASLEPGAGAGGTRLQMEVQEGPVGLAQAWADNYGNRYTGAQRVSVQGYANDLSGQGDQGSLLATATEGSQTLRLGWSAPLGYAGFRIQGHVSALRYRVGKEQAAQRSEGSARTAGLGASYPWLRSREANLTMSLVVESKALQDQTANVNSRDKRVQVGGLTLAADAQDAWGGGGLNNLLLGVTRGDLDLARNAGDLANDAVSARTQGGFGKLNATLARLQRVTDDLSLFASLNAQHTGKNLDSSEKFILGGPTGVRAYPSGEASGDTGHALLLEARLDLPVLRPLQWGEWQALAFHDRGCIALQARPHGPAPNASGRNHYCLAGSGLGVVLTRPGAYALRAAWSRAQGANPGRSAANGANSDGLATRQQAWLYGQVNF